MNFMTSMVLNAQVANETIKTSLVLSSVLAMVMLVPFALDADDTVSFVMLSIFCLAETLYPLDLTSF